MSLTRRLLLAFALMAGLAPAFAQAPPPVPALPDAERRTSYSIAGTTCACAVNFALYGDSTDFGNWLEVFINGILQSSSTYTITSPTGPLANIPRPITDAVLTFNSVQTGTVQIVGARRPRRVSQFTEGRGVAARDLNQVLTDIIAQNRETWDKTNDVTGRALLSQPGVSLGLLPVPSACVSNVLGFDSTGLNPVCVPSLGASQIGPNTITNTLLAKMAADTVKCNPTGSLANAQDCTSPAVTALTATGQVAAGALISTAAVPDVLLQATGQALDQKNWDTQVSGTALQFRAVNDAFSSANAWMTVTRGAGATVSSVAIPNLLTLNPAGASDALDITENLSGAAHQGLSIAETITGSMGAGFNYNLINVTSDNGQCGSSTFCNGLTSQMSFGGAAMTGGRQAIQASVTMTAASSASNTNRNYVAGTFIGTANTGDNGTNTGAGALGAMFGLNAVASLKAGATNYLNISGGEVDVGMDSTASTKYMLGWTVASGYNGVSNGSGTAASMGAGFNVSGITAQTLDAAYIISDINTAWPIKTSGTLQRAFLVGATPTVTGGTDWSAVTFTSFAFKSTGFQVSGTGAVAGLSFTANGSAGVNCSGAPTGAFASVGGIVTHC